MDFHLAPKMDNYIVHPFSRFRPTLHSLTLYQTIIYRFSTVTAIFFFPFWVMGICPLVCVKFQTSLTLSLSRCLNEVYWVLLFAVSTFISEHLLLFCIEHQCCPHRIHFSQCYNFVQIVLSKYTTLHSLNLFY